MRTRRISTSDPGRNPGNGSGEVVATVHERTHLGPYRLLREVGRGGMGVVYEAMDEDLERRVALKVILPEVAANPGFVRRLRSEARAAAALQHEATVGVYRYGIEDGQPYISMEFVEGDDLAAVLQEEGPLTPEEATRLVLEAAQGLRAAAQCGIIHRDLKPSNLIRTRDRRIKVMDFGVAKRQFAGEDQTCEGAIVGTPSYMAPEQALGEAIDHRADIYALGCTWYTLLSGERPFDGDTPLKVLYEQVHTPLEIPAAWKPVGGGRLVACLRAMTEKDPDRRLGDWDSVVACLEEVREALAPPTSPPRRSRIRPSASHLAVAAAALLFVLTGLAAFRGLGQEASPPPDPAPGTTASAPTEIPEITGPNSPALAAIANRGEIAARRFEDRVAAWVRLNGMRPADRFDAARMYLEAQGDSLRAAERLQALAWVNVANPPNRDAWQRRLMGTEADPR